MDSDLSPKSVCIICDGNRIYSILHDNYKTLGKHTYVIGWDKVEELAKYLFGISYIQNVYMVFTIRKNHLHPKRIDVMKPIADHLEEYMKRLMPTFREYGVRNVFLGDIDLFVRTSNKPSKIEETIKRIEYETSEFKKKTFFQMYAYDYHHELMRLINKIKKPINSIEELIKIYYGRKMNEVDLIIRTGRPRLSRAIPLLVGEYSDFYIFPAPFPMLKPYHIEIIFKDYKMRISSKGGMFCYSGSDIKAMHNFSLEDFDCEPLFTGTKVENVWLPINKR